MKLVALYTVLLAFDTVKQSASQNVSITSLLRKPNSQKDERQLFLFNFLKLWPTVPVQPIFYHPVPAPAPPPAPVLNCASLPTGPFYHIIAKHSNMAINVEQASLHNGASLLQWPVSQARNDNWRFESVGSGYYQILAEHSGKAINGKMYCIHKL
jgi:Ricin-type beta-trefoil lectin domain-like